MPFLDLILYLLFIFRLFLVVSNFTANLTLNYQESEVKIRSNSGMFKTYFNTSAVVGYMLESAYRSPQQLQPLLMTEKPVIDTNINRD